VTTVTCAPCGWTGEFAEETEPRIQWCPRCQTGITVPPPGRDVFSDDIWTAEGGYDNRLAERDQWLNEARNRVDWIRGRMPSGRLLEVGAATGEFVATALRAGYRVTGIETSEWAVKNSRTITQAVHHLDLRGLHEQYPDERFDGAAAFHTLEHIHEPRDFLAELRTVIKPGGLLFLEVPNGASRDARPAGHGWWMSRFHDHVYHYNPASLRQMLDACGFARVKTTTHPGWIYSSDPAWKKTARIMKARQAPARDLLRAVARAT
jgi:SAM-dependent methyltransferase